MNRSVHSRSGFTMVEIMIVVGIIALLAAVAIPAYSKMQSVSQSKAITNNLRQINYAAQQYMLENGVAQVGETQLVGTTTDFYLHQISTVAGENYSSLIVYNTTTQIIFSTPVITVTYNL